MAEFASSIKSIDKFLCPYLERFVYGLFYPAILGTNLLLLYERLDNNFLNILKPHFEAQWAWLLTLLLFILDYSTTFRESLENQPMNNCILVVTDILSAVVFLLAHTLLLSTIPIDPEAVANYWGKLACYLGSLIVLCLLWYIIRLFSYKDAFKDEARRKKYKKFVWQGLYLSLILFALFILIKIVLTDTIYSYYILCIVLIIGWFVRQLFEYKVRV